ncbi:SPOR domain-containing protein [Croceibacterium ferulae]|uniref:SPOR domain-containing protein n=1 Tax=Croceibacterium ferulae TaxID=1854641 RepID=UPI000EAE53B4|nr:SPOR domain-containing protein [Croceibacterium ferulae]
MARDEDGTLRLALEDEQHPWLDGDEDEDAGLDTARVARAGLATLVVLLALGLAGWWLLVGPGDAAPEADGSLIEAPAGPYKVRPTDPGGRTVEGTGDTSFKVAEGRAVEARVERTGVPAAPASLPGLVGVQIGAYPTKEAAEAGWQQMVARLQILQGRSHRVVEGRVDNGVIWWLQVVAGSAPEARALCGALRREGGDCQVKR